MAGSTRTRAFGLLTAAAGGACAAAPARAAALAAGRGAPAPDPLIVRVLGARQLAQGLLTAAAPRRFVLGAGAATDALHALSMIALAGGSARYRRPALASAALAAAAAGAAGALAVRGPASGRVPARPPDAG